MLFPILATALVFVASASGDSNCAPVLPPSVKATAKQGLQLRPNVVSVRGRELRWNGAKVSEKQLASYLHRAAKLNPVPPVLVTFDYRDCTFARHIEAWVKASYPCLHGRCSQGRPQ
jgi:hypothetical protein